MSKYFLRRNDYFIALALIIVFSLVFIGNFSGLEAPRPKSDLLRNVISYAWGFDYKKLYPLAIFQPLFNPYIGFDLIAGLISLNSSPAVCVRAIQSTLFILFVLVTIKATRAIQNPLSSAATLLIVTLATLACSRMVEARPELVVTLWLLSAVFATPRQWLIVGGLACTTYWLSPLYAVGAFLLPGTWKLRCKTFAIALSGTICIWLAITQGEWFKSLLLMPGLAANRIAPVKEDMPFLLGMLEGGVNTFVIVVLLLRTLLFTRMADLKLSMRFLIPIVFFMTIGKYRHLLIVVPLLSLWSLYTKPLNFSTWRTPDWGLILVAILTGMSSASILSSYSTVYPKFNLPSNSYVLTSTSNSVFFLPFENPGKLKIVPSVEYASDSPESHRLTKALMTNTLTCVDLETHGFTHVLAREAVPLSLPCLASEQSQKKWVLWKVLKRQPKG